MSDDPAKGFVELTTALKTEGNEYREAMLNLTAGNSNLLKILQNKNGLTKKEYDEVIATFVEGLRNNLKGFLSNDGKSINPDLYDLVVTGTFKNAKGKTVSLDTARNIGAKQSDLELLLSLIHI